MLKFCTTYSYYDYLEIEDVLQHSVSFSSSQCYDHPGRQLNSALSHHISQESRYLGMDYFHRIVAGTPLVTHRETEHVLNRLGLVGYQ